MKITIDSSSSDQRFDRFLRKYFKRTPEVKLTDIFSWIRKGAIKVNNRKHKQDYRLQQGDVVARDDTIITEKKANDAQRTKKQKIKNYDLQEAKKLIIQEDEHRLIFNKPTSIAMHPGAKHLTNLSLHDIMKSYLDQTGQDLANETFSPSFCFRLDRDTSGVVIAAKSYPALQHLNMLIRERKTSKQYLAIVIGAFPKHLDINAPLFKGYDKKSGRGKMFINKEKGVESRTEGFLLETRQHKDLGNISLVRVKLHTGRMHQIRIHMAHAGYPIVGDLMYGNTVINRKATKKCHITRQLLHSRKYGFFDPFLDTEQNITATVPQEFATLFPKHT